MNSNEYMMNCFKASAIIKQETKTAGSISLARAEEIAKKYDLDMTHLISEIDECYIDVKDNTLKCRK